jgi:hypothetical protein
LAVRRKLDIAGLKISLSGWQSLSFAERLVLCHLPVDREDELCAYRGFLQECAQRASTTLSTIAPEQSRPERWRCDSVPEFVQAMLSSEGLTLMVAWSSLSDEERYCVVKYCDRGSRATNLAALIAELNESAQSV